MKRIQAIETRYAGALFRSRLEARWAVFFDQLKVPWLYEYEGFETRAGWYLPDFYMPDAGGGLGQWVEIKPTHPTEVEKSKLLDVVVFTGKAAGLLIGDPLSVCLRTGPESLVAWSDQANGEDPDYLVAESGAYDLPAMFNVCPQCGAHGTSYEGGYVGCKHAQTTLGYVELQYTQLFRAAEFARAYRF